MQVDLNKLKDELAKEVDLLTRKEAWEKKICASCQEPALSKCHSKTGIAEYFLSGLCEECFDKLEQV